MSNLYKRGPVWWGRFQRDGTDIRRSLRTGDRRVAEKRLRQLIAEVEDVAWGGKPRRTWPEVWQRFMREHFPTIKQSSATRYAVSLKALSRILDGKTIDQVTRATLSEFETLRRTDGVTASSIRRDLICLSLVLTYCEEWEWIAEGGNIVPAYLRRAKRRGLKESRARTRYLSHEEEVLLIGEANPLMALVIQLAVDTGLRDQELMSLTWGQIDLDRGVLRTTTNTKSGRARHVPLLARSAQLLAQHPRHISSPFVLCRGDGSRYARLNQAFEGARRRAGLEDVKFHDLRRTAGCRWLQDHGAEMQDVSAWLGHSSIAVTETRYAFLDTEASAQKLAQNQRTKGI